MAYIRKMKSEKGELMVLFSGVLILLLLVTGASADFMLYSNKQDKVREIGYLIKDTRYDLAEPLFNSHNPQKDFEEIAYKIAAQNDINPANVKVEWKENFHPMANPEGGFITEKREAVTTIEIKETYDPIFLKMFNVNEIPIKVSISDKLEKDTEHGYVWTPGNR